MRKDDMITEDQLEQLCIEWFRNGGYEYAYGPNIAQDGEAPERMDYRQVVLMYRLISSIQTITPHISLATLEEAALRITKPEYPVLIRNNRAFHKQLIEGLSADRKNR